MIKKITLTFLLALTGFGVYAQRPGGRPDMPADGKLIGTVLEYGSETAMGYANVVLFSQRDSTMVSGTVTAMDGSFTIEKLPFGRYYLVGNFIGFKKEYRGDIKINPQNKVIDIGKLYLHSSTEDLKAVEITAQKEHIEYQIDKKVVNVGQDIMAEGGTAVTALENTPSVQVDIDGNVSLRGSGSFTVLIDGRPSVLEGSDALQQIPASNIDQIEIITNPSAKYDPDGVAGIINVILKEKIEKGFNGVVNAAVASNESMSFDFLLNYRYKKFNYFIGADYRDGKRDGKRTTRNETLINDTTFYRNSFGDRGRGREGYGIRGGFDYYLSDMTSIGVQGRVGYYEFNGGGNSNLHEFTNPLSYDSYSISETTMERSGNYYDATLNFQHKFDDLGHQLDGSFNYRNRDGDDTDGQNEYVSDMDWNIIDSNPYKIQSTEKDTDEEYRLKLDYTKPVGEEGKIEAGVQVRIEDEKEVYIFSNNVSDEWIEDTLFSNQMDFRRDIYSAYGIYSNKWHSWGYQLGLRSEYTYREIKNQKAADPSLIDRWDYFPTLHLSKSFANKDQMLASYTRRIDRPNGRHLDPFVSFMDQYNYRQGNPDLDPEYTDSYEVAYQKRLWESMISLEGYYRVTNNKITRIRTLQADGTFMNTYENLNNDYSIGGELMISSDPLKWLNITLSGNVFHYRLDGEIEGESVDTESLNWNSRFNAVIKLPKEIKLQVNGMYYGPSVTAQGESEGFFMTNAAVKKDFFERHLTATFSVRDIFSTGKHEMTTSGTNFYTYDYFDRDAPIFNLSLSWKISNYKREASRNGDDGDDMDNGDMEF